MRGIQELVLPKDGSDVFLLAPAVGGTVRGHEAAAWELLADLTDIGPLVLGACRAELELVSLIKDETFTL